MRVIRRTIGAVATLLIWAGCSDGDGAAALRDGPDPRAPRIGPAGACGYRAAARLTGDGIGSLVVGRPVAELEGDACVILRDSIDPLGPEGAARRLLLVEMGPDTITVEVAEDRISRLDIGSRRIRTVSGLAVGTPLDELLGMRDLRGVTGEGRLFAVSPSHCGLSFALGREPADRAGTAWTWDALASLPETLTVSRVLANGCLPRR